MDWAVKPGAHFGYSQTEVESQVGSILNDSQGWERAGVVARHNPSSPQVVFEVVEEAAGESPEAARCFWNEDPVRVELEYAWLNSPARGWGNLVNHESGHAFFWGTHEGGLGIMTDIDTDPFDWPTDQDIADVIAWLAGDDGDAYWFPGDIGHHFAPWTFAEGDEVRLNATVLSGVAGTSLKAVWGRSFEAMDEGRFHDLTGAVSSASAGQVNGEWQAVSAEAVGTEVLVGVIVRRPSPTTDLGPLVVGLAEVQKQ
jgi:hypothetical protein